MRRFVAGIGCALALTCCGMKNPKVPSASVPADPPPAPAQSAPPASPAQPSASQPVSGASGKISSPALPGRLEPENEAEKKLDGNLLRVARAARTEGAQQAEATAKGLSILGEDRRIKIEVALMDKSNVPAIREAIAAVGGQVIVALENHVFVFLPPASIETLARRSDVFSMATPSDTVRPQIPN